ncbi:hypothetical protein WME98_10195 [Sorangium sp. So ce296]|uniref:hypothetical protein n=1 Tax=Sorangium sp. So ce296 TaxID=3133296 RepID=UPI003F5DD7DF
MSACEPVERGGSAQGGGGSGSAGDGGSGSAQGGSGSAGDGGSGSAQGGSGSAGDGGGGSAQGGGGSAGDGGGGSAQGGGGSAGDGGGGSAGDGGGGSAQGGGGSAGDGGGGSAQGGGSPEACVPGSTIACYSGTAGTSGVGRCTAGVQTCHSDGFGYGPCTGEVTPSAEVCATPEDESCDGDPHCPRPPAWARGFGGTGADLGLSIASDAMANYYVTGYFEGTVDFGAGPLTSAGGQDVFLLKLDPSGALLWSKRFGSPFNEIGWAVAVDGNGDVRLAGSYHGDLSGETAGLDFGGGAIPDVSSMFVAKLDADGNHIWSDGFDLYLNAGELYVRQMAVDALGNAYIAFEEPGLTSIMKVDAAGHALWLRPLGGYASYAADLALDSAGNVAAAYRVTFDGRLVYALVSKLSPAGDVLWQGLGIEEAGHVSVAVNPADEILVTTSVTGLGTTLTKLDENGGHVFTRPISANDELAIDPTGNIFVSAGGVIMLAPDGTERWRVGVEAGTSNIAVSPNGAVAVTGGVFGAVDFGTGPISYAGGRDGYVAVFNPPASGGEGGSSSDAAGGGEELP